MKYRHGTSKIKKQHHMIPDLQPFLERIQVWDEIDGIIPGKMESHPRGSSSSLRLSQTVRTPSGMKLIAKRGRFTQEVFIVSSAHDALAQRLTELPELKKDS